MGEIEIYYSDLVAARRQEAARDKPEPSWIGRAKIWTSLLNVALALRTVARVRHVQYLAALIFIVSSVGMIAAFSFALFILAHTVLKDTVGRIPIELALFGPAAAWLALSPVIGVFIAMFSRRRTCSRPLAAVRFMGSPAREFLKAWDGILVRVDKKIGRILATPIVWLAKKPSRYVTLGVILVIGFVVIAYGLLVPAELVAWGNQYGSGLRAVGGGGFFFVILLVIAILLAELAFMLFVAYVWFRSALVALPSLLLYVLVPGLPAGLAGVKPYAAPAIGLVTFVPSGVAETYNHAPESWPALVLMYTYRIFVGSPGFPTTIGMILTGVLIGWLPYFLEQLDKPTPREVVARHGWSEANDQADETRKHQVFTNALWGSGLVVFVFGFAPLMVALSDMDKPGWLVFMFVIIPVGIGLLIMRAIVKKVRKSGRAARPRVLDMTAKDTAGTLGEPEKLTSIEEYYSPLARLLSEAQRRRSVQMTEEPAAA